MLRGENVRPSSFFSSDLRTASILFVDLEDLTSPFHRHTMLPRPLLWSGLLWGKDECFLFSSDSIGICVADISTHASTNTSWRRFDSLWSELFWWTCLSHPIISTLLGDSVSRAGRCLLHCSILPSRTIAYPSSFGWVREISFKNGRLWSLLL